MITILSAPTRLTGSISCASSTETFGKFRAASQSFLSKASTTMRPVAKPSLSSFSSKLLRFRLRRHDLRGHEQPVLAQQLRQHRAHRAAVHLAVDLLREVARPRGEGSAAADPDRAANRAHAGTTRALLLPRLLAAAAHVGAILLGLRAGTRAGQMGRHDLMHERLVERGTERRIRELERAFTTLDFDFHRSISCRSYLATALMAGRTTSWPFSLPATAPFTSSRLRSASTLTTSRLIVVTLSAPKRPAMRLPGNTRPGVCR